MLKAKIKAGREYAFRAKRGPGVPLQPLRTTEHIRANRVVDRPGARSDELRLTDDGQRRLRLGRTYRR
jgi:hypothetical protein